MAYLNGWTDSTIKKTIDKNFTGRALNEQGKCAYLTKDGKKCAVGIFIPEGHEAQTFAKNVAHLLFKYTDLLDVLPLNTEMLFLLQKYHDQDPNFKSSHPKKQKALLFDTIKALSELQLNETSQETEGEIND